MQHGTPIRCVPVGVFAKWLPHMTMPARYSEDEFMAELERCGYDFTRLSNEIATRDAEVPSAQLVADLRSDVLHHWTPPGGGYRGALNHVVIHSLDVSVPLEHFGIDIEGRIVEARDLDWTYGSGQVLQGAAEDLALALCGRNIPSGRIKGAPLQRMDPDKGS
jgi:hypothetical protein